MAAQKPKGGGGPTASEQKAQKAADERRETITAAQTAAQRYVAQSPGGPGRPSPPPPKVPDRGPALQAERNPPPKGGTSKPTGGRGGGDPRGGYTGPGDPAPEFGPGTGKPIVLIPRRPKPIDPAPTPTSTEEVIYFSPPSFAPPPPAPVLPVFVPINTTNFIIKQAPLDTIVFNDNQVDVALLQDLLYEDIAGVELANISREDLIDGQQVSYSPIVNLPTIKRNYNPNNLISSNIVGQTVFSRFAIDLILRGMNDPYIDSEGNLVIEIDTIGADENIEVQILSSGTINKVDI